MLAMLRAQAGPAGAKWLSLLKAEERGHREAMLVVTGGRVWWGCWGQWGHTGDTRGGGTLLT